MNVNTGMLKLFILAGFCIGAVGGCGTPQPEWKRYVRQQVPITVQKDKPVQFQVDVRNGSNPLGLQCAPEVWQTLTNGGVDKITIRLVSSSVVGTEIYWVRPGWPLTRATSEGGGFIPAEFALFPNTQFLSGISGKHRGTATVQITFPGGPDEPAPAEIIVRKDHEEFPFWFFGF